MTFQGCCSYCDVVLGVPSMQGRDQLMVKWDDGGFVAVSAVDECESV